MDTLIVNKNRGWRGLSEAKLLNEEGKTIQSMIFSFSQAVWDDMLQGLLVMQDEKNYIVLHFGDIDNLPHPTQQRSVLIKNAKLRVADKKIYSKLEWLSKTTPEDYGAIYNFIKNKNNHTTSDWNCIRNQSHSIYIVNRLERRNIKHERRKIYLSDHNDIKT